MNLRDRIIIERESAVSDGGGGRDVSWSEAFRRWGALAFQTLSASLEGDHSGENSAATRATVTMRADEQTRTITAADRFIIRGEHWNLRGMAEFDRTHGFIRFIIERGVST